MLKIQSKTPVQRSLFNKVLGPQAGTLFKKKALADVCTWEFFEIFQSAYSMEHLPAADLGLTVTQETNIEKKIGNKMYNM